ncbi:oligosaccharide flippase family protein, partial [Fulvivirga lutimaris]|uniref:oligosaccharide flippase family protein n=1 Tax=Fulvivirga lutimaris TaxID=1819566 RepID=UPI0012BB7AAC
MIARGVLWDLIGKVINQGITFIISIFLARLLLPADFGLVGMVMAFISIAQVFINMGFQTSLVQNQNVTQIQYSTIFWINLFVAFFIGGLFIMCAKYIGDFYKNPELVPIVYVLSITFITGAIGIVNQSMLIKRMDFKKIAFCHLRASFFSGIVGIYLAFNDFGVWALVFQYLLHSIILQILLFVKSKWLPLYRFSFHSVQSLW